MDLDAPDASVPFYRRGGFWLGVASAVPLLFGGVWVLIDQHGRAYAADVRARMAAAGYQPARMAIGSSPVPTEQNFCAHPLLQAMVEENRLLVKRERTLLVRLGDVIEEVYPHYNNWHGPESPCLNRSWGDLRDGTWRRYRWWESSSTGKPSSVANKLKSACPEAPHSTLALDRYVEAEAGTDLASLEARLDLPFAQMPDAAVVGRPWYDGKRDSASFKRLVLVFSARGQWSLENDNPTRALRSVAILLRFASALDDSVPQLWIYSWWGNHMRRGAADVVWLAARDRRWTEADWQTIARWAGDIDSRRLALTVLQQRLGTEERMWLEELRSTPERVSALSWNSGSRWWKKYKPLRKARAALVPYGWFEAAVAHVEWENWSEYQEIVSHPSTSWPLGVARPVIPEGTPVAEFLGYSRLSRDYPSGIGGRPRDVIAVGAQNHVLQHFIRVTAALERWHLAHGDYPAALAELVPGLLDAMPTDLDGAPLRYAREDRNNRYKLWSVALNGTDDGGRIRGPQRRQYDRKLWLSPNALDWVWEYP